MAIRIGSGREPRCCALRSAAASGQSWADAGVSVYRRGNQYAPTIEGWRVIVERAPLGSGVLVERYSFGWRI